jgi:hypothetical protein
MDCCVAARKTGDITVSKPTIRISLALRENLIFLILKTCINILTCDNNNTEENTM